MNIYQIVFLLIVAVLAGVAGFRAQKNGWIVVAWIPAFVVRMLWVFTLSVIALSWAGQSPVSQGAYQTCYFLTAAYLPWWFGVRFAAFFCQN
jgi:hypothetical protein